MDFDRKSLERLLAMDNVDFGDMLRQISQAVGADQAKTESALSDVDGIKRILSSMSPEDAQKLINSVGKEKSDEILRKINRGV